MDLQTLVDEKVSFLFGLKREFLVPGGRAQAAEGRRPLCEEDSPEPARKDLEEKSGQSY